jgi:hypothetical protein
MLKAQRRLEQERPALLGQHSSVLELHHDFAAALSLKRKHTLTCAFPESLHLFVVRASFNPELRELDSVCCWPRALVCGPL